MMNRAEQTWNNDEVIDIPETTGYYVTAPTFDNLVIVEAEDDLNFVTR